MGVEVSQDEAIIPGLEKSKEGWRVVGWARGRGRNVDVVKMNGNVVDGDSDSLVFYGGVVLEEIVCREFGVRDGVVDKCHEAAPA